MIDLFTQWINTLQPLTFCLIMWLCMLSGFCFGFVLLAMVRNVDDETNRQEEVFHQLTDNKYRDRF